VQECIEKCPQELVHCSVRLLRKTVIGMGNEPLADLIECALDEHWREAFQTGLDYNSKSYENFLDKRLV